MLISCKCLNFIASSSSQQLSQQQLQQQQQQQQQQLQLQLQLQLQKSASSSNAAVETADSANVVNDGSVSPSALGGNQALVASSSATAVGAVTGNALATTLMHVFLQKYPRNFIFYSQFMEFFKQSVGPIADLTINAINQRDLIYSVTIDIPFGQSVQTWQLSLCINCNVALCAKKLQVALSPTTAQPAAPATQFLVNQSLLTSNEELAHRRADKSFSDTFGVRIMDHPEISNAHQSLANAATAAATGNMNAAQPLATFAIGSLSSATQMPNDPKQLRLRQLHAHLQQRLKREIAETNERIQRYTEQQFALLKSFREKSEQEYDLLMRLIQKVPEQHGGELMDRLPPMLEVSAGAVNYLGARRRNTIGSRRDLNSVATAPTTPTTPSAQYQLPPNFLALPNIGSSHNSGSNNNSSSQNNFASAMETNQAVAAAAAGASAQEPPATGNRAAGNTNNNNTTLLTSALNRKMSNFDTPPATPEATPMSVGNSPTFKQQEQQPPAQTATAQQQQQPSHQQPIPIIGLRMTHTFQQQFPTPTVETADDCLFELEGFDDVMPNSANPMQEIANNLYHQQQQHLPYHQRQQNMQLHLQLQQQRVQHQHHNNNMSDLDESDAAEEAEDALDLDSSMPIPMHKPLRSVLNKSSAAADNAQLLNFAKSLPIEIANSPMAERSYIDDSEEEVLDNTVDIAASIKALAKSVHGEAVFGDLPRPRLRSEI